MSRDLKIPCALVAEDGLQAGRSGSTLYLRIDVDLTIAHRSKDDPPPALVHLDALKARELFNWLGVQLHKGGLRNG